MSGSSGGESWWWSLWRCIAAAFATFGAAVILSVLLLVWRDAWSGPHLGYCLYVLGGLVAAGYVVPMFGANSAVGSPGFAPPTYAYYPLDRDLTSGRRPRMGDKWQVTVVAAVLVVLFWGGGAIAELYL